MTQNLIPRSAYPPDGANPAATMCMELRRRSFFRRTLVCRSSVAGAAAYGFTYRKRSLVVDKDGRPFASTDGCTYLRVDEVRFKAERHRALRPPKGLFADKGALLIDWGDWARNEAEQHCGARISVACNPAESYVVSRDTSWPVSNYLNRVIIEAPRSHAHLDRMVACLAFFWMFYEARRG